MDTPKDRSPFSKSLALANPEFSRLTSVHMLNASAEAFIAIALAKSLFFSVSVSTARNKIAISLMLTMLPFSIVAPFLGPAMDKFPRLRRNMLLISTAGRALTCAFMTKYLDSLLLFPLAFISVVLGRAYGVAKAALVPTTVSDETQLVEANSKLTLAATIAGLFSLLLGTAISSALHASRWSLWFAGVVFVIAFSMATSLKPGEIADGRIRQHSDDVIPASIPLAVTVMATLRALVGFVSFVVIFYMRETHHNPIEFGAVLVVSMSGSFFGALLAPILRRRYKEERIIEGALGAVFACTVAGYYIGTLFGIMLFAFSVGVSAQAAKVAFDSLIQRDSPSGSHGTTFARFEAGLQIMWVIGAFIAVLFHFSIDAAMFTVALVSIGVAVIYWMGGYVVVWSRVKGFTAEYMEKRAQRDLARQKELEAKEAELAEVESQIHEVTTKPAQVNERETDEEISYPEPKWKDSES